MVLLIDDERSIVRIVSRYFEMLGISWEVAENGAKGLEKVMEGKYSLVLMDVQMPVMDGLETARRIREREQTEKLPRLPIIGMTAFAFAGDRQRCIEAGMDDFIAKPFEPTDLKSKIFSFLGKSDGPSTL